MDKRKIQKSHKNFICIGCGKDTWNEYYMLYGRIWRRANPREKGMLCISCVEEKLGRKLTKKDFTKAPVNIASALRTAILKNRLSRS